VSCFRPLPSTGWAWHSSPTPEGWRISYILHGWPAYDEYDLPSGPLSNAYDLHIAAAAALKPLVELGERAERHFERRDAAKDRS
jgi:hypothetical protein